MFPKKSICVIGGGGFMGSALRNYLFQQGYSLITIGRSLNISLFENETYYSIGEYSYKQLETILSKHKFEAIIDLAYTSVPNTSYEDPVRDFSENLTNVTWHLEFADSIKAERFIYISSGGTVYGDSLQRPYLESDSNYPLSPYGITKLACERYVYMHHRTNGLRSIVVRPSNIYGPGQKPFRGQGLIATALGLACKGEPLHVFGNGDHVRDYLFINDFCKALVDIMKYGEAGETYNLGSGKGVTINEVIKEINIAIKDEGYFLNHKYFPGRPFDVHYNVLNIEKFGELSGWEMETELSKGIFLTWQWIKEHMSENSFAYSLDMQ
jgi:UDP-glucose 4-epimerase